MAVRGRLGELLGVEIGLGLELLTEDVFAKKKNLVRD